jgi:Holliday junction resolvasome RuvABC endonuclease subunit
LSLDISTTCTGYCIFGLNGIVIKSGAIKLDKEKNFFNKVRILEKEILSLSKEFDLSVVAIEESLQSFRPGFSSAKTLFTLSKFNGITQYICFNLGMDIHTLNVNTARRLAGIKIDRKSSNSTKEQVIIQVSERYEPKLTLPKKILKTGPRKGLEVYENSSYDIADAYVIGKAYCLENS